MSKQDYYEKLGVSKNATIDEINKAYRKMAVKKHPDKFMSAPPEEKKKAEEQFKELNQIHEILSDPQKRADYDMYGNESLNPEFMQQKEAEKMFSQFGFGGLDGLNGLGGLGGLGGMFQQMNKKKVKKPEIPNINVRIKASLKDIYEGNKLEFEVNYYSFKENSKEPTEKDIMCKTCNGLGEKTEIRKMGNMLQQITQKCPQCNGSCFSFSNTFYELKKQKYMKAVPLGAINGQKIVIEGKGHDIPKSLRNNNKTKSDVILIIEDEGHFEIDKLLYSRGVNNSLHNLKLELKISPAEAICGTVKKIKFIDNSVITFNIPPGTIFTNTNNNVVIIPKKGLPMTKQNNGDLYIVLNVEGKITKDENKLKQIWKILCDNDNYNENKTDDKILQSITLEEYKNSRDYKETEYYSKKFENNMRQNYKDDNDDEDNNERTFRGQPQCAQQ